MFYNKFMKVIIVNPPMVQQNTAYPSGAYLASFFRQNGFDVLTQDLNIKLFHKIFSKEGLTRLFDLSEKNALSMAERFQKSGDDLSAFNIRRYVSSKHLWINWITFITQTLQGSKSTREKAHEFLFSPFVPRASRMEQYLSTLKRSPCIDDINFLCTYALADLSDYITTCFDSEFSLIRYAESLCTDNLDFSKIINQTKSPFIKEFFLPVLEDCKNEYLSFASCEQKIYICISVPFAGTFVPSLAAASFFKSLFLDKAYIFMGGGYINTDLRTFYDARLCDFIDAFSFDRGYGSYKNFFSEINKCQNGSIIDFEKQKFYKMKFFNHPQTCQKLENPTKPLFNSDEYEAYENKITSELVPDYSDIDFSVYPRLCDDKNPMHRLWTDGAWIKAYLAHGCYWHKCAFCDTKLDYVCSYKPVNENKLFDGLMKTATEKDIYGIHFVDEALPPAVLKRFAIENAKYCEKYGKHLFFWGNVRFEKAFTKDLAALLVYCGLGAVSAGLEVATQDGLKIINKGTDLDTIIASCAAFKEAGVLVHAYMIYGFWYDDAQSIIDSMETLRQFFSAGLLDSSFWHKFILTKDSKAYEEHHKKWNGGAQFEKYGEGLQNALEAWMHGKNLETKVTRWFDFEVPSPKVAKNIVEKAIEKYERENENRFSVKKEFPSEKLYWLGTRPLMCDTQVTWLYLQDEYEFISDYKGFDALLWKLRPGADESERVQAVEEVKNSLKLQIAIKQLHYRGIVVV